VENGGETSEAVILSAPLRAFAAAGRRWGVFLPLYALRSREGWGAGDIGMMQALADWLAGLGGSVLATLPLLPAFLDEPFEPSPYAPVSRLWWNEFYIHAGQVPELARCPEARSAAASAAFQREAEELRESPMVDYRRTMALKRGVLEQVAGWFFESGDPARRAAFEAFAGARPEVQDYARFRAMAEGTGVPWRVWPEAARGGRLRDEDVDVTAMRYHMYVQWISHEQIHGLSRGARSRGVGLYLDLPLGVHADGYDTWRERGAFAEGVSTGAPPDTFFSRGQDWGFPPPHPDGIRAGGYRHLRAVLRHHLSVASILRVDHVMGLHRLYWIPAGMDPSEGVYVRYPSEEIYAALSIESHRHRALIAGEDLGTVPRYVPAAMARHGLHHTYVLQYEVGPDGVRPPPVRSVASLNTHDMPPFAAFWEGLDIEDHADLGLYTAESAARQRASRQAAKTALAAHLRRENWLGEGGGNARDVMTASLRMLAGNKAAVLVVNLEDMWLETRPQNVPGTSEERPNWRRKAWHTLEEIQAMPQVEGALRNVDRLRRPGVRR
jgi:4-alpha-glucanotransferase